MSEAIKVVEVEQVGDSAIVVIFSNGTRGLYSAEILASLSSATPKRAAFRDRAWAAD